MPKNPLSGMTMSGVKARRLIMLALLGFLSSLPVQAGIISSEEDAGTTGGSRLRNDDRILIWPKAVPVAGGAVDTPNIADCTSLYNRTKVDYFVPWRTDSEWQAFLAARANGELNTPNGTVDIGRCCKAQVVEVCGVEIPADGNLPPEKDTNLGQRILAARNVPADPEELLHYGAIWDVKALVSQTILNNNLINYQVTYMCDTNGTWVKTRELGSCEPVDGACNSTYTSSPLDNLPSETLWESTLCASGSILNDPSGTGAGPFVTGTGPWTWQCDGTPGRGSAICVADYNGCSSNIPAKGYRKLPALANLCKTGNTAINVSPLIGNGPWDWECQKTDNGHITSCHAEFDPTIDGICNPTYTNTLQAVALTSVSNLCLQGDGVTLADAMAVPTCDTKTCVWTCAGSSGGKDTACTANRQQLPGLCGSLAGTTKIAKPADGDPNLCSQGTSTIVSGTANGATWNWTCLGSPDPVATPCSAPNLEATINGMCGSADKSLQTASMAPVLSDAQLCSAGTPQDLVKGALAGGGEYWTWTCAGLYGGAVSPICYLSYLPGYAGPGCGSANNGTFSSPPSGSALCGTSNTAGALTNITSPYVGWQWTCDDALYPGSPVTCMAKYTLQPIKGGCGTAKGKTYGDIAAPPSASALCANGGAVIALTWPTDPFISATVTWGCAGQNGGADTAANACYASFVPPVDAYCGVAKNWTPNSITVISSAPAYQLCQPSGSAPSNIVATYNESDPSLSKITWTCSAGSVTGKLANCSAQYVPTPQTGVCGTIPTSIVAKPAESVLCGVGTSQNWVGPVAGSGPGTATWSCKGLYGGATANCSQTGVEVVNPTGQCGQANGAYVPNKPNYNLCAVGGGSPSMVTGEGPWSWTCGSAAVPCEAYPCTVCSGTLTNGLSGMTYGSKTLKIFDASCQVNAQPIWSADAQLQISNDVPVGLSWTDDVNGNVNISVTPSAAPKQYCAPCYMKPTHLNPSVTGALVEKVSGTCPEGVTETPSILPGWNHVP